MNQELQISLMRQVLKHLEAGTTDLAESVQRNSAESYTSSLRLQQEEAILFQRYPLLMGLSCQMPNPGDRLTNDLTGTPILLVRGEDGAVRAFRNACRHRGARVAGGLGTGRNLVCQYHGWTYELDGRLRAIPDHRNFPGVELASHSLEQLPVAERHGMIWAQPSCLDGQVRADVQSHLGGLDAEIASYGLERYHHYECREIRRQMNWKLAIDTFLEPYHLGVLHRRTVGPLFFSNLCLFEPFGPHLREVLPRRSVETQRALSESEWDFLAHNTIVYVLFPNTVFVVQVDHVETWRVFPIKGRADECVMHLDFYVPEPIDSDSARRHWQRNMDLTIATVCEEDFPTCEGMQQGFRTGASQEILYGRNEPALAHFQKSVAQALTTQ